ncbi:MAG TPA: 2Fe-2S iron-sulfur cluster-binding protein [Spirochaetota bacterium]|nr:2Fe-2S iron-sulfur cluster-binding protein [Spirochaetota bacterium]HNT11082.1 2Fe-2S iron-sulfur cluster-binding protein [Spirochaetota bacterium]
MKKVKIVINGKTVEGVQDQSVLSLARENGMYIPSLCYNAEVQSSGGSCRVCLVEVHQGKSMRVVTSCNYPVREGIEVKTDTEFVRKIRKGVLELLLCRAPESSEIKELAARDGITEPRFFTDGPDVHLKNCIACSLCTQVCEDVVGVSAISMVNRGREKQPAAPFMKASNACIGCGACAYACPTGAIEMNDTPDARTIWGKTFVMQKCSVCSTPFIPKEQAEWIIKTTGKDRAFFEKCPTHR